MTDRNGALKTDSHARLRASRLAVSAIIGSHPRPDTALAQLQALARQLEVAVEGAQETPHRHVIEAGLDEIRRAIAEIQDLIRTRAAAARSALERQGPTRPEPGDRER